ncbi:MAG: hypothetical protein HQ541_04815 [Mariniphaga sp.]|nr:hypothetical protein [Mariniphaga sp.]
MKKALLIATIVIVVFLGALIAIPVLFKGAILEMTKSTIKKQMGVEVGFSEFNLSLFKNFPKASLALEDVFITGINKFQNDTLLRIPVFSSEMSLKSLFNKDGAIIGKLRVESPVLKLMVGEDGTSNWDFSNETESGSPASDISSSEEKVFQLGLEDVIISNADVSYEDKSSGIQLYFNGTDIDLSGKMYGTSTDLNTWGMVDEFKLLFDSLTYISNTTLETNSVLTIDYEDLVFDIKESELLVNRLPLILSGNIKIPNDSVLFDLDIQSEKSGLDEFLALIPPDYEKYLIGLTATGNATMEGDINGVYYDEDYPAFKFAFKVDEGKLKYTDLPEEVKNITADISLNKPQGPLELMEIKISQAHSEVKNSPVDLTLSITKLFGDPFFDGGLIGKINFDHLKDALPLDSVNIAGEIDANLFVKAGYSAIMNEQYDQIKSDGIVYLSGFSYSDPDLTKPVYIPNGQLNFSPEFVELTEMDVRIGQSAMRLSGRISNYLGYFLSDGLLIGNLDLKSQFLNLNELMNLQVKNENISDPAQVDNLVGAEEQGMVAFDIPENLDLKFTSNVADAYLGELPISQINGLITVKNGKLVLDGLKLNMFEGVINLTGSYENNPENIPVFDFGFDVSEIDLPVASRTIISLQQIMSSTSKSQGKISTRFNVKGRLSEELKIVSSTVDGIGSFSSKNIKIIDSPTFDQLKSILNQEKLKNISLENFTAQFNVDDGNLLLRPFETKIAGQHAVIEGSLNVDDILNLKMDFVVERAAFGPDIQEILEVLPGQENILEVPVTVLITGLVGNPEVKMDYSETRKYITDKIKESTSDSLKKSINKIGNALKKLIEK